MVLATVKGDVHDIGKNLVDIILTNNGYKVHNLGIKQPIEAILQASEETGADAIGMSGLLVKSTLIMKDNLELMNERGVKVPVILGGAALTRRYVEDDLKSIYKGSLYYAHDAFAGLRTMDQLVGAGDQADTTAGAPPPVEVGEDVEDLVGEEAKLGIRKAARPRGAAPSENTTHTTRSAVDPSVPIPTPPFYGSRVVADVSLDDVFAYVNENALFKGQWQFKQGKMPPEQYYALVRDKVRPIYEELKERSKREQLLVPKVVYGYFACQSAGNDLIVYDENQREHVRFTFPRQPAGKHLCLADFFASQESGRMDVVGFHLVTVGRRASEYAHELFTSDNYADYLYFHGLSVESAEALAEFWHKRIRQELGIAGQDANHLQRLFHQQYQGSRYSFGYPACPRLEDQEKLFTLLNPERIDVSLTEEFQLEPEQSTSAIIVHHPEAKYFSIE
jgi:5-methyltetrahydrofolate--homocysteine methyltransferase